MAQRHCLCLSWNGIETLRFNVQQHSVYIFKYTREVFCLTTWYFATTRACIWWWQHRPYRRLNVVVCITSSGVRPFFLLFSRYNIFLSIVIDYFRGLTWMLSARAAKADGASFSWALGSLNYWGSNVLWCYRIICSFLSAVELGSRLLLFWATKPAEIHKAL